MSKFLSVLIIAILGCGKPINPETEKSWFLPAGHNTIRVTGRVLDTSDSSTLYWPGSSILFRFTGSAASIQLNDERGENYFNIILDGDSVRYIKLNRGKQHYVLAEDLPYGEHTVEVVKRTEWDKGHTVFYGVTLNDGRPAALPPANTRVIEFFGNSITAGYAIENYTGGDSPDSVFTNNYYTYGALTARHFNADYYATVKSGIGILVSWFPLTMPQLYNRLDPTDSASRWDFTKANPQVVVINLFQNDAWLLTMPQHPSFKKQFGTQPPSATKIIQAYTAFVTTIRQAYPQAKIICALGCMDATKKGSPWPGYVTKAVEELKDPDVYTLFFPYMNKGGHPRLEDNREMARILIAFIEKNIDW